MNRHMLFPVLMVMTFASGCHPESPELAATPPETIPHTASTLAPGDRIPLIYDDDGSPDGTSALLYLLGLPEYSIEAVSISYGEAHPDIYIQYMGRMLEAVGNPGIPLAAGQDMPLAGGTPFPEGLRDLSDDFWHYPLPLEDKTYPAVSSPELMVSIINESAEPVTLFISGPCTNLAQALRIDPGIAENIEAVYIMGGAIYSPGNITGLMPESDNRVAEWNILTDPLAAKEVFEAGLDLYLIPLDATNKVIHRHEDIQPWYEGDAKATIIAGLYEIMFTDFGMEMVEIFDLTAAVVMAHPETCQMESLAINVVTDEGDTQGQTSLVPGGEPNVQVCITPDAALIKQILDEHFAGTTDAAEIPPIMPVVGTWQGTATNNGSSFEISITIEETFEIGEACGWFDIPVYGCSGTFTWVGMAGERYQFEAGDKTEACGDGDDFLVPQADGTLMYISQGDYGESIGILERVEQD